MITFTPTKYLPLEFVVRIKGVVFDLEQFLARNSKVVREGNGTPLQYSCLENPMDRGTW